MPGIIPGYEYDVFISYRQKNEGVKGRKGEREIERCENPQSRKGSKEGWVKAGAFYW